MPVSPVRCFCSLLSMQRFMFSKSVVLLRVLDVSILTPVSRGNLRVIFAMLLLLCPTFGGQINTIVANDTTPQDSVPCASVKFPGLWKRIDVLL